MYTELFRIKCKHNRAFCCTSPLWQLCQETTGGTWTGCQSKLPEMAGIPRAGRRSSAGGKAECQPLQKEANVSVRGYYCLFLADLQSDKNDQFQVCSPFTSAERKRLKLTEFTTCSLKNCNTWGNKILSQRMINLKLDWKHTVFNNETVRCSAHLLPFWILFWSVLLLDFIKYDSLTQVTWLKLVQNISALQYGP